MTGLAKLSSKIKEICEAQGLTLPTDPTTLQLNLERVHTDRAGKELKKLKEAALKKGGKLLSTIYINAYTSYSFRCKMGHTFMSTAANILHNTKGWCPYCGQRHRASQIAMNDRIRGLGVCLTEVIENVHQIVRFKCDTCFREFDDIYDNVSIRIKQGLRFCPFCKKER
jgi:formate dehydrogenase maturation protein FdhE